MLRAPASGLLLVVLAALPARAAPPVAAIRYSAPPECPGPSTFFSLLQDRTAGTWRVRAGDGDSGLVVEIRDGAAGKIGRVRRTGHADQGAREIAATDCRDLVQALVLSTALSLDQQSAATGLATIAVAKSVAPPPEAPHSSWIVGGGALTTFLLPSQPMPQASLFIEYGRRS
jgi:hypothetical protein